MASRITELVLDCSEPERLASFWCEVLGYEVLGRDAESVEIGQADRRTTLLLSRDAGAKVQKLRLHIDLTSTDRDQSAELERLIALGARLVDIGQGTQTWHVLEDPEGNEFCLLAGRAEP